MSCHFGESVLIITLSRPSDAITHPMLTYVNPCLRGQSHRNCKYFNVFYAHKPFRAYSSLYLHRIVLSLYGTKVMATNVVGVIEMGI